MLQVHINRSQRNPLFQARPQTYASIDIQAHPSIHTGEDFLYADVCLSFFLSRECTQPSLERDSFLASPGWSRRSTGANTEVEEEMSVILG